MIMLEHDHYSSFKCIDCLVCTFCISEYYMLTDKIWFKVLKLDKQMLCIGCVERRLGYKLNRRHFNKYPVNTDKNMKRSARLTDRLAAT